MGTGTRGWATRPKIGVFIFRKNGDFGGRYLVPKAPNPYPTRRAFLSEPKRSLVVEGLLGVWDNSDALLILGLKKSSTFWRIFLQVQFSEGHFCRKIRPISLRTITKLLPHPIATTFVWTSCRDSSEAQSYNVPNTNLEDFLQKNRKSALLKIFSRQLDQLSKIRCIGVVAPIWVPAAISRNRRIDNFCTFALFSPDGFQTISSKHMVIVDLLGNRSNPFWR